MRTTPTSHRRRPPAADFTVDMEDAFGAGGDEQLADEMREWGYEAHDGDGEVRP